ncbi:MAG: c-type cytochrome [Proteobacteria bacterium]|nr:c-type cytochrome [Pseudomonadota bacterium]NIS68092.1 c-type cytochrome [Pseudomonadota bacterium]
MGLKINQQGLPYLITGSLVALVLGIIVTILIPALGEPGPSKLARSYSETELRGRLIYQREGCWYCHTQQVRPPEVGIGTVQVTGDIGPETTAGDYALQKPVYWGTERQGPDLSHVASRPYGAVTEWHILHLKDPDLVNPGTVMPSYAHLPEDELEALAAYMLTLK